jgi:hypothetical protein
MTETARTVDYLSTNIRMPKRIDWLPREDITPYELAMAVPALFAVAHGWDDHPENMVAALPDNVRRHFRIYD